MRDFSPQDKFVDYYEQWISIYKKGAVRDVTLDKYKMALKWLQRLVPDLTIAEINRVKYQNLLNDYAESHERQTTMDFHHQIKGAVLDDGLIVHNPTRKVIIKGKEAKPKKTKYLNQFELHSLLKSLYLGDKISWEWFILLVAKTGMRFLERHCKELNLPVISVHGLRHTHASLLLFAGVSTASVSRRLGHANIAITQKIYLHIIQELENQDVDLVMRSMTNLV